jgi:chromosome segregation ATPase
MEISEIKKKIMERIEKEKSKTSRKKKPLNLTTLSARMGKPEEDLLKLFNKPTSQMITSPVPSQEDILSEKPAEPYHATESPVIDASPDNASGDYRERLGALEEENIKLKDIRESALNKSGSLLSHIEEKDKEIADLKKKFQDDISELEKDKDRTLEKSIKEYSGKLPALEIENKKLKKLHEDALKQNDSLLMRIEEKDSQITDLANKLQEEHLKSKKLKDKEKAAEEHREVKDKALANTEALRSKLYVAAKETKELSGRIAQLEDTLRHSNKRLAGSDKVYKALEKEKNDLALELQAAADARKSFEEKIKLLGAECDAKDKKVAETEKFYNKNIEAAKKEMELSIQAIERNRKVLEGKIAQLNVELDAKNKRIEETEESNNELDNLVKESALKLQAVENLKSDLEDKLRELEAESDEAARIRESDKAAGEEKIAVLASEMAALKAVIKEKETSEEALKENIFRLESELEARDKKIQADIKYCESIVKEVNDLRQKIKAYRLKVGQ